MFLGGGLMECLENASGPGVIHVLRFEPFTSQGQAGWAGA